MFKISYELTGTPPIVNATESFVLSGCALYQVYNTPGDTSTNQNTATGNAKIWYNVFVKISNVTNQQTLPYIEMTASLATNWPSAITLSELRIAEMNKDSVGADL